MQTYFKIIIFRVYNFLLCKAVFKILHYNQLITQGLFFAHSNILANLNFIITNFQKLNSLFKFS